MSFDYRNKLHAVMQATLEDELRNRDWTYHAVRPMFVPPSWHAGQRIVGDCSKGVQYLCRWSGAPDPMGNNFASWGNSSTLCAHLPHLDHPSELLVGDIVTFGTNGDEHAAMVYESGPDPLLWSFGHQGAPNTYRLSQDRRERQLLRNPVGHHVETPQDKLREKKDYWSWLKWTLGEGEWASYGKSNYRVRPNVPKRIPMKWWVRRAKFIKNRNKANEATT